MKRIRHIALGIAALIMLMHTLIPHRHKDELNEAEHAQLHVEDNAYPDLLTRLLHEHPSEGFLTEFAAEAPVSLEMATPSFFTVLTCLWLICEPAQEDGINPDASRSDFASSPPIGCGIGSSWDFRPPPVA